MRVTLCAVLSLVAWVMTSHSLEACSCASSSRCEAYRRAGAAYIGEVVSSQRVADTFQMTVRIVRASRATKTRDVLLTSDARTTCGVQLDAGRRYVIYGDVSGGSISACSYIYGLADGDPEPQLPPRGGRVEGQVSRYDLERIRSFQRTESIPGASVWIDLPFGRVYTTADGSGHFAFDDVPPGTHRMGAEAGSELATRLAEPVTLDGPNDCADVSLVMHPSGKITARVLNNEGRPVVGLLVVLLDARKSQVEYGDVVTSAPTREGGAVVFDGLDAGEYLLTINPGGHTSGERPYPPTFYGGTSRATASRLGVGGGQSPEPVTFTLPAPLPTRRLTATVTCADGSVPAYAHATIHANGDADAERAPSFTANTLSMPLLRDRGYLLEITAAIPYGPIRETRRSRRGEPLTPVQIPAGAADAQISVVAPFTACADSLF